MTTELDRSRAVGAALREARGLMSVEQAAQLSGLSRQWWYDAERGDRNGRPTVMRATSLARAVLAVGGDLRDVFGVAGLDPRPFLAQDERWRAARDVGAEIAEIPTDDDELKQLDADILDELKAIRTELQRLGDAYSQLAETDRVPPPPAAPPGRRATRATPRAKPASE